jgi:uncharacterized phiE125 gp8 family phage protein
MALVLKTAPTIEPVTLAETKAHLRLDSGGLDDALTTEISIAPGSHDVAADYSLEGGSVDVGGYEVVVNLVAGTCGSGGTVDVKLQESDNDSNWTDVSGGSFTQVTEANDNAVLEMLYGGTSRYIRAVATVAVAACEFGVNMVLKSGDTVEDDLLDSLIAAARQECELRQNRAYIDQTWELWLDSWPGEDYIRLPRPPLGSVTSVKYYDTSDNEATFSTANYRANTKDQYTPKVSLKYGKSWPSTALRPHEGICVTYVAGYGATRADVPKNVKQAMLLLIGHFYENREAVQTTGAMNMAMLPMGVEALLSRERVY